jgi:SET domain-containing protein
MIEVPLKIEIKDSPGKGLGVFAKEKIFKGEIIEICPLIKLDVPDESSVLFDYRFGYPPTGSMDEFSVIALGYGCIYNHSEQNNAEWRDGEPMTFEFFAIKDIEPGEEICTCYGGSYYFELRPIKWV